MAVRLSSPLRRTARVIAHPARHHRRTRWSKSGYRHRPRRLGRSQSPFFEMMRTLSIRYVALPSTFKHRQLPVVRVTVLSKIRAISYFVVCPGFPPDFPADFPGFPDCDYIVESTPHGNRQTEGGYRNTEQRHSDVLRFLELPVLLAILRPRIGCQLHVDIINMGNAAIRNDRENLGLAGANRTHR